MRKVNLSQASEAFKAFSRGRLKPALEATDRVCRRVARAGLDWLAPPFCRECGGSLVSAPHCLANSRASRTTRCFCAACLETICWIERPCLCCATSLEEAAGPFVIRRGGRETQCCAQCIDKRFHFDTARAAAQYSGALRTAVLRHKFQADTAVAALLVEALLSTARAGPWSDVLASAKQDGALVTVPLHPWKRWRRGWDPLGELAQEVAAALELPLLVALRKVRRTPAQISLRRAARCENLRGAFALCRRVRLPKRIVLLDDVITTGTTASRCAYVLKHAGVEHVAVLAVARS